MRVPAPAMRALFPVDYAALPRVPQQPGIAPEVLAEQTFLNADQPLVLPGLVAHWPLVQQAEPLRWLREHATAEPVTLYAAPPEARGRVFYDAQLQGFNFERRRAPLADCCDWLEANALQPDAGTLYVGSTAVARWLPAFAQQHALDLGERQPLCSLWLGNQSRIAAHFDFPSNLACVVDGRRRFVLFPPEQAANLYPGPLDFTPSGQPVSLVDFAAVDSERYPRFSRALAAAQVAELGPGDALFIPRMWWHHVESLAPVNVLVNYWWRDSPLHLGSPMAALLHAALAVGQLPAQERAPWARLFSEWVLEPDAAQWAHLPGEYTAGLREIDEARAAALREQWIRR